jgi:hypothetical protein
MVNKTSPTRLLNKIVELGHLPISWNSEFRHVCYIQRRTASTVSPGLVLKHIFEDDGAF